jgi:DNA-binding MarR family transcriptional regulator
MASKKTEAAELLTEIVLLVFRLDAGLLDAAERIAAPAGLTAARWKVLGAVLEGPRTVAEIGRHMGLARQSVQRLADVLVRERLATFHDNPAHRSAKLLTATPAGRAAISRLRARQSTWANAVSQGLNMRQLRECKATLVELIARVEAAEPQQLN